MMLAVADNHPHSYQKKRSFDQGRGEDEDLNSSREGAQSPATMHSKAHRDPEEANSPGIMSTDSRDAMPNKYQKTIPYPSAMDTSPASYPKHVIVPSPPDAHEHRQKPLEPRRSDHFMHESPSRKNPNEKVVTPVLTNETRYENSSYRQQRGSGYPPRGDGYGYYESGHGYGGGHPVQLNPKKWACDYCGMATFMSYEEACAHEEVCTGRNGLAHCQRSYPTYGPSLYPPRQQQNGGLQSLYNAAHHDGYNSSPRMPLPNPGHHHHHDHYGHPPPHYHHNNHHNQGHHHYPQGNWGPTPPMPSDRSGYPSISPRFQDFRVYDEHHERAYDRSYRGYQQPDQRRMSLSMSSDTDSLSDRQCYVRSHFVEVFAATEKEVTARHSKGAQKLVLGQVGIRCLHCAHLRPKDRAERAVCYPSSISRIYQTVADMQRFHFEQCRQIPEETRVAYKSLKTTRPRGVGSPQTYWVQSAKLLGLVDSEEGIRFADQNNLESL